MNYAKNDAQIRQGDIVIGTPTNGGGLPGTATVQVLGTVVGHNDSQIPEEFQAIVQSTHLLISDEFGNRTVPFGQTFVCVGLEPVFLSGTR